VSSLVDCGLTEACSRAPVLAFLKDRVSKEVMALRVTAAGRLEERLVAEEKPFTRNHYLNEIISKRRNEGLKRLVMQAVRSNKEPAAAAAAVEALFEANERLGCAKQAALDMQAMHTSSSPLTLPVSPALRLCLSDNQALFP
jgi:hypothetical protein